MNQAVPLGQYLLWTVWLGSILVVCLGCLLPLNIPALRGVSTWLHVLAFLWLTALLPVCLRRMGWRLAAALLLLLLGLALEWAQGFVPGRTTSGADAMANLSGVALGLAGMSWVKARFGACTPA